MAGKKKKLTEKKVRESLEAQLREKGADVAHFQDILAQYMDFRQAYLESMEDYRENGKLIKVISAAGKTCDKENPAIKQAAIASQQMRAILKDLGLTTENCTAPGSDGCDLW